MMETPERLLAEIVAHARRQSPDEVCGWLAGREGHVKRVYPVPNVAEDRRHAFSMEPEAQLRTVRDIREAGFELAGTYHSHPRTPPYPSLKDRQLAYYPNLVHLIVSLVGAEPVVRGYLITDKGNRPVRVSFP